MKTETKKVFFDAYQTLIDIDINEENKKRNQTSAWGYFVKSLEEYGMKTSSRELMELNKKRPWRCLKRL